MLSTLKIGSVVQSENVADERDRVVLERASGDLLSDFEAAVQDPGPSEPRYFEQVLPSPPGPVLNSTVVESSAPIEYLSSLYILQPAEYVALTKVAHLELWSNNSVTKE